MNEQPTHDQLIHAIMDERHEAGAKHVSECSECRMELAAMKDTFRGFRDSVRNWTDSQTPIKAFDWQIAPSVSRRRTLRWSLAAAAAAIVTVVPVYRHTIQRQQLIEAASDARLLEQVSLQLSRALPGPMEPLVDLLPGYKDGGTR